MESKILVGDCLTSLRSLEAQSVQTCVTSPPYFGLRDYGHPGQIGLEATPDAYVAKMVEVFREVRRVLRDDGTLWLNLGDSYASIGRSARKESPGVGAKQEIKALDRKVKWGSGRGTNFHWSLPAFGTQIKQKDLIGIPWRVAFALQADGWYLRQDIIWAKPNPMPESVRDRCTKAHEYIFMLSKSARYYYDADAIAEPVSESYAKDNRPNGVLRQRLYDNSKYIKSGMMEKMKGTPDDYEARALTRNKRSVWTVTTKPFKGAHFATFPPDLIEPCILAGCPPGGAVLDPFGGAGTTGMVARRHGRNAILCELNPEYAAMAEARIAADAKKTLESLL
jgi:DNA modification methylase